MKSLMLAKSNIRKNISSSVILVILVSVATMMLYLGSDVILRINHFIDQKNQELNGADIYVMTDRINQEEDQKIAEQIGGVKATEVNQCLLFSGIKMQVPKREDKAQSATIIFLNADESHEMSKLEIIDQGSERTENSIIVPNYLKFAYGYETGDTLLLKYGTTEYKFIIYGFAEDIMLANPLNSTQTRYFIYNDMFKQMEEDKQQNWRVFCKFQLNQTIEPKEFDDLFVEYASNDDAITNKEIMTLNYSSMKRGIISSISIFMVMLVMFAVIILIVSMVIIRFSIVTHIEENIKNLGSMIAIGYKTREIKDSLLIQFGVIGIIGWVIGYLLTYPAGIIINQLVSTSIGLQWNSELNLDSLLISIFFVLILILFITARTASKLKKLTPVTALRNGIETYNFKKNYFRFDRTSLPVNLTTGLKSLCHSGKNNLVMGIISLLISFTLVFSLMVYYNFIVNDTAFLKLIGLEKLNIQVKCLEDDYQTIFDQIAAMDEVERTVRKTTLNLRLLCNGKESSNAVDICNDYSKLAIDTMIEGRHPIHANEIVLSNVVSNRLGAGLGDVVKIGNEDQSAEYIVVGICQHICYLGESAMVTEEGIQQVMTEYEPRQLNVYLKDQIDTNTMIDKFYEIFAGKQIEYVNMDEFFSDSLKTMNQAVALIAVIFTVITLGIIILTIYYLVKVKLIKNRQNIGISKALGFTTAQLIRQTIVSFCPVIAVGSLVGGILSKVSASPLTTLMLSLNGIKNAEFYVPFSVILISFAEILLTAIVTAFLSSLRIRHIVPKDLIA